MIRLAFVGCGKVVEAFHLPALARVEGLTLGALVDSNVARARALAESAGAPDTPVSTDLREIVDYCDAAVVALPNALHANACAALLERGRHVLVEKPMATSVADCDRMIETARAAGAVLGVAMVRRFIPAYQLVAHLIAERTFGEIRRVAVREGVAYNWPATTGFFLKRAEAGGGVLVDFGSHVLDALWWWLGPLSVRSYEDDAYGGVEAECRVGLMTGDRVPLEVELSRLRHLPCTARIEWARATLEIDLRSGAGQLTIAGVPYALRGHIGLEGAAGWHPGADPFTLQLRAFAADIQGRIGVAPTARTAQHVAAIFAACDAMRKPLAGPASPMILSPSAGVPVH